MLTDLCHVEKLILLTYEALSVEFLWSSCLLITVFGPRCTMADIRSLEGYLGFTCITLVLWNLFHYVMCRSSLGQTATRIFALTILKETHEIKGWRRSNQFLLVSKWASWVHNPCTLEIRHWVCATYINRDHCYFRPFGKRRLKLTKPNLKIYSYNPDYFLLMKANRKEES